MSGLRCQAAGIRPVVLVPGDDGVTELWRMPPGWPGCSPPAGAAGLAWAPAGPAEAWSALPGCASRMRAGSPMAGGRRPRAAWSGWSLTASGMRPNWMSGAASRSAT